MSKESAKKAEKIVANLNITFRQVDLLADEVKSARELVAEERSALGRHARAVEIADELCGRVEKLMAEIMAVREEIAETAGKADEVIEKAEEIKNSMIEVAQGEIAEITKIALGGIETEAKKARDEAAIVVGGLAEREEAVSSREAKIANAQAKLDAKALAFANGK